MTPLLSICVPTYNKGDLLRVMLQALLPQVAVAGSDVEVVILDNASEDSTSCVIEEAREIAPFRVVQQPENLGPTENIVQGPRDHATGDFSWILGHHNLLLPGALARILEILRGLRNVDLVYANFRCASYPDQWPEAAMGGFDGAFSYLGNARKGSAEVPQWLELVQPDSALCTQSYAHIVRTRIWRDYWKDRPIPPAYTAGISTYPHTWMLAETCLQIPAFYIAEPVVTIFNGAQSWGDLSTRLKVYTTGLPQLLRHFRRSGMSRCQLRHARHFGKQLFKAQMSEWFRASGTGSLPPSLLAGGRRLLPRDGWLLGVCWEAYVDAQATGLARAIRQLDVLGQRARRYLLCDCRPARWVRSRGRISG